MSLKYGFFIEKMGMKMKFGNIKSMAVVLFLFVQMKQVETKT